MVHTVKKDYKHEVFDWIGNDRMILLTAHRRENLGDPMRNIFSVIKRIVNEFNDIKVVYPIHTNPKVREIANEIFGDCDKARLIEPLEVFDFHNFMNKAYIILTDSGGVQEEAPSLVPHYFKRYYRKTLKVLKHTLKLVGTNEEVIYEETKIIN